MKQHRLFKHNSKGFTIIELLITLSIVGVLVAISVPFYISYVDKTKSSIAASDLSRIAQAIDQYHSVNGVYPDSLEDVFMDSLTDPWGNPYVYTNIANSKGKGKLRKDRNLVPINSDYDLFSKGPDGKSVSALTASSSKDDIIRASNGAYVGIAEDY